MRSITAERWLLIKKVNESQLFLGLFLAEVHYLRNFILFFVDALLGRQCRVGHEESCITNTTCGDVVLILRIFGPDRHL
jgi:hypothetical protein